MAASPRPEWRGRPPGERRTRTRRLVVAVVACALGVGACGSSQQASPPPAPSVGGVEAPGASTGTPRPARALPAPGVRIPGEPSRVAAALSRTTTALHRAVDEWRRHGDPARAQSPGPVVRLALHQQRVYRHLARHPELARRTLARLPGPLAAEARDNVAAARSLFALAEPVSDANSFRTQRPPAAGVLLGYFRRAERRFGVEWQVLAAVMFVESKFGRVKSPSSAGAQGPMQFLPSTWDAYGMGGDIRDPRDAVLAAANYLHRSGAPDDYERALYAYNPSDLYVDAVLRYARRMKRDSRSYYAYYNWQVFVLTTRGDVRITGPGPRR